MSCKIIATFLLILFLIPLEIIRKLGCFIKSYETRSTDVFMKHWKETLAKNVTKILDTNYTRNNLTCTKYGNQDNFFIGRPGFCYIFINIAVKNSLAWNSWSLIIEFVTQWNEFLSSVAHACFKLCNLIIPFLPNVSIKFHAFLSYVKTNQIMYETN